MTKVAWDSLCIIFDCKEFSQQTPADWKYSLSSTDRADSGNTLNCNTHRLSYCLKARRLYITAIKKSVFSQCTGWVTLTFYLIFLNLSCMQTYYLIHYFFLFLFFSFFFFFFFLFFLPLWFIGLLHRFFLFRVCFGQTLTNAQFHTNVYKYVK